MWKKYLLRISLLLLIACLSHAEVPQRQQRWISISSDSREVVHEIIRSEVDSREAFSSSQEEKANQKEVEREKEAEEREYRASIAAAGSEFTRAKKKLDEITSQFQSYSNELEESLKRVQTNRAGIENLESEIGRYEQEKVAQSGALKQCLRTEKHGEVVVAVLYTRGFRDSVHELEGAADRASAPLIAQHMGSYLLSFTRVIDNVLDKDFIRTIEQGSCKWNNEEPLRLELSRNERGTTYLRLKRYELYPFQENSASSLKPAAVSATPQVAIVDSRKKLEAFLTQNGYGTGLADWGRIEAMIKDSAQLNAVAEEGVKEQVKMFEDRIAALRKRIAGAREDLATQRTQLRRREDDYYKISLEVAAIRERKEAAERAFHEAQAGLNEKKRSHESIIVKTAVVNAKGSQSPAEASAEAILDKLAEVKNDAKTQHSSTTTEVTDYRLTSESTVQSVSEARIVALRLISFVNEGESVRVKVAFRVKTLLESVPPQAAKRATPVPPATHAAPAPSPSPVRRAEAEEPAAAPPANIPEQRPPARRMDADSDGKGTALGSLAGGGCRFMLREVELKADGLHLLVEVKNWDVATRKVAFYDDSFGSWTRSSVLDSGGRTHVASQAFLNQGGAKTRLADLDKKGRVPIAPQSSVYMELVFATVEGPADIMKINLHPFVYTSGRFRDSWQEFDIRLLYEFPATAKPTRETVEADQGSAAGRAGAAGRAASGKSRSQR